MLEQLEGLVGESLRLDGAVHGGDINQAFGATTTSGRRFFIKANAHSPRGMFTAEAEGLRALGAVAGGCAVPEVVAVSEEPALLVLSWIERGRATQAYWEALGRGLAAQHRATRDTFGFEGDNFIGHTPQPNPSESDWIPFYRDHRIVFQQRVLREKGRCSSSLDRLLDTFCDRMDEWLQTDEPPALLHGDLWGGNAMADASGAAVIYDPAAYYGCREADVAMTELFGGFDSAFYAAYNEVYPLQPGYPERRDLYNLYHVLNHANLFGGGYASQAEGILRRFL
jgi:protein-ribulosamine 3-kinase